MKFPASAIAMLRSRVSPGVVTQRGDGECVVENRIVVVSEFPAPLQQVPANATTRQTQTFWANSTFQVNGVQAALPNSVIATFGKGLWSCTLSWRYDSSSFTTDFATLDRLFWSSPSGGTVFFLEDTARVNSGPRERMSVKLEMAFAEDDWKLLASIGAGVAGDVLNWQVWCYAVKKA